MEVSRQAKCVSKEIPQYALVAGSYRVVGVEDGDAEPPFKVHLQLTSPEGNQLHYGERQTEGHFGFRATKAGDHTLCVWLSRGTERDVPATGSARAGRSKGREKRKVEVAWRVGKSKDAHLSEAPRKEQVENFDSELLTLEGMAAYVADELEFFHERELELRQVVNATHFRITCLSLASLLVCISLTALQFWHLKSFFHHKKLLHPTAAEGYSSRPTDRFSRSCPKRPCAVRPCSHSVALPCSYSHCLPTPHVAPCCSQRVALCCPARRALLQPARRALLPLASRPAALHSARPAALSCSPRRPAATTAAAATRATAAAGGGAAGSAGSAAGAGGAGGATGSAGGAAGAGDCHCLSWPLSWQLQRLGVDSGGHCLSRTTPPLSSFASGYFSEPVKVVEALVFYVLHRGGIKAAALGASEFAAALGASESAAALGASEFAAALGAHASPATCPSSAEALHTFTLDSGASLCFFCDYTTLTPLAAPVPVSLADPTGGPVVARASSVLPCPAVPSGSLSGLHLPTFSTNLVKNAAIQDVLVDTFIPGGQRVAICTCCRTGRHLTTFTRRPGSSLYTLTTASAQVAEAGQ
ncbi:unnamed protein product, partial [Closterium sp. NIES-54]